VGKAMKDAMCLEDGCGARFYGSTSRVIRNELLRHHQKTGHRHSWMGRGMGNHKITLK
jgi:hypothetical protein